MNALTKRQLKAWQFPAIDEYASGSVMVDTQQIRALARRCGVYPIGKMLAKARVPIRSAVALLLADDEPQNRHLCLLSYERIPEQVANAA